MTTTIRGSDNWDTSVPSNIVQVSSTTEVSVTSVNWVDLGIQVAITPFSAASKIKLEFNIQSIQLAVSNCGCSFRFVRGSTALHTAAHGYQNGRFAGSGAINVQCSGLEIDSPNTTNEVTYKLQVRGYSTAVVKVSRTGGFINLITATEVAV